MQDRMTLVGCSSGRLLKGSELFPLQICCSFAEISRSVFKTMIEDNNRQGLF